MGQLVPLRLGVAKRVKHSACREAFVAAGVVDACVHILTQPTNVPEVIAKGGSAMMVNLMDDDEQKLVKGAIVLLRVTLVDAEYDPAAETARWGAVRQVQSTCP
jgi:hypothetical protein